MKKIFPPKRGIGIHWEEIDEDIVVTTLLRA
jgi:hypothetical protein